MPRMFRGIAYAASALLVAGCATTQADTSNAPTKRAQSAQALSAAVSRTLPSRNLYSLTDELKLHPPRPISHVVRRTSPNYRVGHTDTFWVLSEDRLKYFRLSAVIRAKTKHLYIYVEKGLKVDLAAVTKAANTFEHHTYPTDHAFFGTEWTPGVDGDPHITCLLGNLQSAQAAGFYSAEDEYPPLVNRYSNAREMFYINSNTLPGSGNFDVTLAHEFQHMIHWHMHSRDNAWLNEGMSMLAQHVNGYSDEPEAESFVALPQTQLNAWNENDNVSHYGAAYLFLAYLYERYGRGLIHEMVGDSQYTDFALVNDVLHRRHLDTTADEVFGDWAVANLLDDPSIYHRKYSYQALPGTVTANSTVSIPFKRQARLPPYAADYVQITPKPARTFQLKFSAPSTVPLVSFNEASPFWWSNRGDLITSSLSRTFDLTKVRHAALHFKTRYSIEPTYDYAFVEASVDGKSWTTLRGTHTTRANPTGANYGNGYTGNSKGWENETVNLSRYAGHKVRIRFQYVTDDEVNYEGMTVRDISIPEIGFHDNFTGWDARGFIPVAHNALPSHWYVRLIEYTTSGTTVSTMPLNSADTGSIAIDPNSLHLTKLVAVVYSTAPKTTVQSTYSLQAALSSATG